MGWILFVSQWIEDWEVKDEPTMAWKPSRNERGKEGAGVLSWSNAGDQKWTQQIGTRSAGNGIESKSLCPKRVHSWTTGYKWGPYTFRLLLIFQMAQENSKGQKLAWSRQTPGNSESQTQGYGCRVPSSFCAGRFLSLPASFWSGVRPPNSW